MTTRRFFAWLLFAFVATVAGSASAKSVPTCKSPRNAVDSVFNWQLGQQQSLTNAAKCFERTGRTQQKLEAAARALKLVFDAEAAQIELDGIPEDPEFLDDERNPRVVVHPRLPDVAVERRDGRWVWTRDSLDAIERHYKLKLGWLERVVERMPEPLRAEYDDVALWQYLALLGLLALGVVVSRLLRAVAKRRVRRLMEKGGKKWMLELVDASATPAALLGAALVLRLGYPQLRLPVALSTLVHGGARAVATVALFWAAFRSADVMSAALAEQGARSEAKLDDALSPVLRRTLKWAVVIVGLVVGLQSLEVDVTALLASLSIGTLAFGLAAKDTLANFFGSVSIFVDAPFQIGDWIQVEGIEGAVKDVGFRSTRLRTAYGSIVVIPNAKLADAKIDNWGARRMRRSRLALGLRHETRPEAIEALCAGIRALLVKSARVREEDLEVVLTELGASGWNVTAQFFVECAEGENDSDERHRLQLEILRLADELGVRFASPTTSVRGEPLPAATA